MKAEGKAAILLAPGFEEGETLTVADILRRAGLGCDLVGFSPSVEGSHQMEVQCDRTLEELDQLQARLVQMDERSGDGSLFTEEHHLLYQDLI